MVSGMPTRFEFPSVRVNCKDCVFFKSQCAYNQMPCSKQGILPSNKPCTRFSIDPSTINTNDYPVTLADFIKMIPTKELPKFSMLLKQERSTRKSGFSFGQTVAVKVLKGDFVSNYFKATVVSADSETVSVRGARGFTGTLKHTSVLDMESWDIKKDKLTKAGKLKDPDYNSSMRTTKIKSKTKTKTKLNKMKAKSKARVIKQK